MLNTAVLLFGTLSQVVCFFPDTVAYWCLFEPGWLSFRNATCGRLGIGASLKKTNVLIELLEVLWRKCMWDAYMLKITGQVVVFRCRGSHLIKFFVLLPWWTVHH